MGRKPKSRSKRKLQRKSQSPSAASAPATKPAAAGERIATDVNELDQSEAEPREIISEAAHAPAQEGAVPPEPASTLRMLRAGEVFGGRYQLERILGKGAMGITWLARETKRGELLALKILVPAFTQDPARLAALKESVAKAATLEHPHILRTHDLVEDSEHGLAAVAMEVAAGSIEKLRLERPNHWFEPAEIVEWLRQLCAALEYAHREKQVVHRDLKPANLLLDAEGRLKLADFGIPLLLEERMLHVGGSETSGAPAFMSPEQLRAEAPQPTDDLYALGATLFTLLAGKPPFVSATVEYQLYQALHEAVQTVTERRRELSGSDAPVAPEWEQIIGALLSRKASARPSLSEVLVRLAASPQVETATPESSPSAIAAAASDEPASLEPQLAQPPGEAPPAEAPRSDWSSALILCGIILAAVGVGWWVSRDKQPARNPTIVKPPSELLAVTLPSASLVPTAIPTEPEMAPARALPPFTNSLGMRFVGLTGTQIRVCIWPTRLRDFAAFAEAVKLKSTSWEDPGFAQTPDHPVVDVTWNEAEAFCKWLTRIEQDAGKLRPGQRYRLLTDLEWSKAAGLGDEKGDTPEQRDMGVPDVYPWGSAWPPPVGAGNYAGQETGAETAIKGYDDSFQFTSPVGSFPPNRFGLYDVGGNVWEWVGDDWNRESKEKVARGASWYNGALKLSLLSCCRVHGSPEAMRDNYGFRIALEEGGK